MINYITIGNTGAGKSTTANCLMGISLNISVNNKNQNLIEIDKKKSEENAIGKWPIIGHSLCVSETIFVQSFDI